MVPLAPAPQSRVCALTTLRFLRAAAADRSEAATLTRMADRFPASVVGSMPRPTSSATCSTRSGPARPAALAPGWTQRSTFVVALQEQAGLDVVTDGEYRRRSYIGIIADVCDGFALERREGSWWHTVVAPLVVARPGWRRPRPAT
jgi:5-methyltetrahydropteroyltriglutamate--homocysteine methyltransferase